MDYEYEIEYEYDFSILVFRLHINYHITDPFHPISYPLYLKPKGKKRALETSLV